MVGYWKRSSHVIGLQRFIQTMRAIQGALIVASSIQIILGYSQVWGLFSRYANSRRYSEKFKLINHKRLTASYGLFCRFFSPLGMAPVVGLVGLGLFERGFPAVSFSMTMYCSIQLTPNELPCHVVSASLGAAFLFLDNHHRFVLEYCTIPEANFKRANLRISAYKIFTFFHRVFTLSMNFSMKIWTSQLFLQNPYVVFLFSTELLKPNENWTLWLCR